jgi:hypothetical protein
MHDHPKLPRIQLQLPDPLRHFRRDSPGVRLLALALCIAPFVVVPLAALVVFVGTAKGGIDLSALGALQLSALQRHGLPLSAAGWAAWAARYGVPLGSIPAVWR